MTVEPLLIFNGDGLDIYLENGSTYDVDPIFNTIIALLFSSNDNYHHDIFDNDENWRFRGNYFSTIKKPITLQMLSDLGNAVSSDLSPLVDGGHIVDLNSVSRNPNGKRIETEISFIYFGEKITQTLTYDGTSVVVSL